MNEITIPYHLAIPTIISFVILLLFFFKRKKLFNSNYRKWIWISLIVFFVIYILILGIAMFDDIYCQWDLNRYDLDKDGFFGGNEITKEQQKAMFNLTSDVGRNFSFIFGLVPSFLISLVVFLIGFSIEKIKKLKIQNNN